MGLPRNEKRRSGISSKDPILWLSLVFLAILFLVDLRLPLGVAGGIPFIAVVLFSAGSRYLPLPLLTALIATLLTAAGILFSPPGAVLWISLTNRAMAIAAIWTVALLAYRRSRSEMRRLEERLKSEEKLRRANQDLEAFSRTLSHDLRNHLTPIVSFADFLRSEYGHCLRDEGSRIVTEMENRGNRMLDLMEDLLQLARAGRLDVPSHPVDVEKVVSEVLQDHQEQISETGMEVIRGPLPPVKVPETFLNQVFSNLIVNALRYAGREGGPLEIGSEVKPGRIRYFVRDHGPGIPATERETIFGTFSRGSNHKGQPGSGIGLAIVRKVATLYDGEAWVEETPGGGSTFWIELKDAVGEGSIIQG
jgi:signal transduction histidine kinase